MQDSLRARIPIYTDALCFFLYAAAQLVEALCYNPEGRGFDFQLRHSDF
jgi:hypothetical protein